MVSFHTSSLQLQSVVLLLLMSYMRALAVDTSSSIRLYGGSSDKEGFVQVNATGVWKAICSDGWDALDAIVTCKQLGLTEGYAMLWEERISHSHWYDATASPTKRFPVEGHNFACNGNEELLLSCKYSKENSYCSKLAAVACGITDDKYAELIPNVNPYGDYNPLKYTITTSNGNSDGQVMSTSRGSHDQIFLTGGLCDMDEQAATLICHDQGYTFGGKKTKVSPVEGLPMLVSKLTCGLRSYLGSCEIHYTSTGVCPDGIQHNGVICYTTVRPSVIVALVFAGVSSIFILIAGACGVRWIRKDRKIPHVTLESEPDDDGIPNRSDSGA